MIVESASVKVMRSYDYCHFEVCLSASGPANLEDVDGFRKEAARLADRAVEQYRIAKRNAELRESDQSNRQYDLERAERLREIPESERTPSQKVFIKRAEDRQFHERRRYDYEDEWDEPDYDYKDDMYF